jgi:hypothetical protein
MTTAELQQSARLTPEQFAYSVICKLEVALAALSPEQRLDVFNGLAGLCSFPNRCTQTKRTKKVPSVAAFPTGRSQVPPLHIAGVCSGTSALNLS